MRTTVYPNTENFVMSDRNKQPLSAAVSNVLHLSDAERIKITQIFLRKIPLCCLTQRAAKIVTAVFSQTIDFNKFEDDMNGCRLQQLTNLFPQHANEVVRYLEAIHVLITRKGDYGKYLSINFNFSQWGKEACDDVITNDPTVMLDKEGFMAKNFPEHAENLEKMSSELANQAVEPTSSLPPHNTPYAHTQPDYSEDLLKELLTAIGQIKDDMNGLSEKQGNTEKRFWELLTEATNQQQAGFIKAFDQQQAGFEKASNQQQAAFVKAFDQQQAGFEKAGSQQQTAFVKAFDQQQAAFEKALATAKPADQNTKETTSENNITPPVVTVEPASEPVVEAVVESETTTKPPIEKPSPRQEMTAPLPSNVPTASSQIAINSHTETPTEALIFPSQLSQDQRYDAKKLLQRADNDMQQVLLDMLSKRLRNTHNPVNSPIAYLTNLLIRLETDRLDMPLSALPITIGSGSIAPPEPRPLRDSERRRAEYQEAVADCIQMENNIKLMGRNDSLTFSEALDKFDMRGLWDSICERFTETKEALAAIQPLNALPV